jgi:hypothetical protein
MTRRVIALGVGVLIVILLLLAVKGCLNARKERGFENYASDLSSIVTQSNQLSSEFFKRLEDPPANTDELQLEAQVASDRGSADGLLERVQSLDAPGEIADAQSELVLAFELRRDGLAGIADDISVALGTTGRSEAVDRMVADMKGFLASDVLYARAQTDIEGVLADQGVSSSIPPSPFLPVPIDRWIDRLQLYNTINAFASGTGEGIQGLALLSTTIDKTPLTADTDNSVSLGNDPPDIKILVENQGESVASEVTVSYSLSGGAVPMEGEDTVAKLDSQGQTTVTLGLQDVPEVDTPLTLVIDVLPVPGEEDSSNNEATYTVTFN